MYFLFTTPSCPNCPQAKRLVARGNLETRLIDASTVDGLNLARKYNVAQVPTLIELSDDEHQILQKTLAGLPEISSALKVL